MGRNDFIDAFLAAHCRTREEVLRLRVERFAQEWRRRMMGVGEVRLAARALAAAPQRAAGDAARDANAGEVAFLYVADDDSWRCVVKVPDDADAATMLEIKVSAKNPDGVLSLAGVDVPVEGGAGEMPFGAFLEGLKNTDVAYAGEGDRRERGHLAFF
ncbi:MAG: hypothetical protein IJ802_04550 [Kiritimatiellae bacterium]|nr:hypothetical protein [Kiritimatiellia bacterium]